MRAAIGHQGYTIVEVMIFLAVSGFMFVIAATFISGKQASSEFKQGMNEINTQVQQIINDVNNGFYPSANDIACASTAGGNLNVTHGAAPGSSKGCVFIGKVIQFGVNGTDGLGYNVYSVAGAPYANGASSGNLPTTFAEARPLAVDDSAGSQVSAGINLTQKDTLKWGVKATGVYDYDNTGGFTTLSTTSAIGFFGSFATYNSGALVSGAQTTQVAVIPSTAISSGGVSEAGMVTNINHIIDANLRPEPNIMVCFKGGFRQYAVLTIGGVGGQRLTTDMHISNNPIEGCST